RDHPVIRASTLLAWPVDQVFLSGQFLLEIERASGSSSGPQVRVALADDSDQLLSRLSLTNLPFLGAARRGDQLFIAQGQSAQINWQWFPAGQTNQSVSTNLGIFSLTVLDLSQLPALSVLGQSQFSTADNLWGNWEALWPKPGLMVWRQATHSLLAWGGGPFPIYALNTLPVLQPVSIGGGPAATWWLGGPGGVAAPYIVGPWYWGGSPGNLIAFDVIDSTAP